MSENDAQLELKKRARRRLVGAAALAALAAVVLPMVMEQAPRQQQPVQDIQIRIPAQDAGAFTSRILPVKPGSVPTPLPPAVAEAVPAGKPETGPEAAKPESKAESKPTSAKVSPANTASRPPEPRATAAADEKPPVKKPDGAAAAAEGSQWIVQLGAYRDPANVRNLTAKLKQQGYNFYTEALPAPDGSSRTRVRAGPFPSKEAAEAARERIKRIGVDGVVAEKGA